MQAFKTHTGIVAVLDRGNVDTDQIISKEFLKSISRTGYGEHLFEHWRYLENGQPNPSFELNNPTYKGATILITGNNFGCGSSREHAVWAIDQYGFRVLMAPQKVSGKEVIPGFADIFKNNSFKNGLLLIELSEKEKHEMIQLVSEHPGIKATVNLESQKIIFLTSQGEKSFSFPIDAGIKSKLMEGLDDIGRIEKYKNAIDQFEKKHSAQMDI